MRTYSKGLQKCLAVRAQPMEQRRFLRAANHSCTMCHVCSYDGATEVRKDIGPFETPRGGSTAPAGLQWGRAGADLRIWFSALAWILTAS